MIQYVEYFPCSAQQCSIEQVNSSPGIPLHGRLLGNVQGNVPSSDLRVSSLLSSFRSLAGAHISDPVIAGAFGFS